MDIKVGIPLPTTPAPIENKNEISSSTIAIPIETFESYTHSNQYMTARDESFGQNYYLILSKVKNMKKIIVISTVLFFLSSIFLLSLLISNNAWSIGTSFVMLILIILICSVIICIVNLSKRDNLKYELDRIRVRHSNRLTRSISRNFARNLGYPVGMTELL